MYSFTRRCAIVGVVSAGLVLAGGAAAQASPQDGTGSGRTVVTETSSHTVTSGTASSFVSSSMISSVTHGTSTSRVRVRTGRVANGRVKITGKAVKVSLPGFRINIVLP